MSSLQGKNMVDELENFLQEVKSYQWYQVAFLNRRLSKSKIELMEGLRDKLVRKAGGFKTIIIELSGREYLTRFKGGREETIEMWDVGLSQFPFPNSQSHVEALSRCIDATNQAIGKLESDIKGGYRDEQGNVIRKPSVIDTGSAKAFIAHEGETKALGKVKDFLDALGVKYSIAEIEPSNGRSVEGQVTWTYELADFAIILATKGKAINKTTGEAYMGMNVADELGRARVVFKNTIILLLEKGVEPHTNISEIVHERFTSGSMDKALIKIAKELRGWGLLRASKAEAEIECPKYPKS